MTFQIIKITFILVILISTLHCTKTHKQRTEEMVVHLHSGVSEVARLGENEQNVLRRAGKQAKNVPVDSVPNAKKAGFTRIVHIRSYGARIYFRRGLVALIELQEPFTGRIIGKKLSLFTFSLPKGESWRNTLVRELGHPKMEAGGGRLGSKALFYRWGDVAFNRTGPNEIAIYRDRRSAQFRQKGFGRILNVYPW